MRILSLSSVQSYGVGAATYSRVWPGVTGSSVECAR